MTHKASHGKQMAQHLHPYYPIPTIHNFPIEQLHQTNLNPEEWKEYMKVEIEKAENKTTFQKHKVIGFVPRALFEVKPQSYCPRILTVGPLYQNLEPSSMDRCKALCVKKFMERHKMSDLERLTNEVIPKPGELSDIYFSFPSYNFWVPSTSGHCWCCLHSEILAVLERGLPPTPKSRRVGTCTPSSTMNLRGPTYRGTCCWKETRFPWLWMSAMATIILLILSLLQTIFVTILG